MRHKAYLYFAVGTELRASLGTDCDRGQEALRAAESSLPEIEASASLP